METEYKPTSKLTTIQAAEVLGIKPDTLNQWRYRQQGPSYIKVGRSIKYRFSELVKWMDSNSVTPAC